MSATPRPLTPREVLGLAAALSLGSLLYEMTIAACFVVATGDAPLWQSLTIGLYLAALGAGTWACGRAQDTAPPVERLWRIELALAVAGGSAAVGLLTLETGFRIHQHFYAYDRGSLPLALGLLAAGHLFTLAVGALSGFEIPLLLRLAKAADPDRRDRASAVLGVGYFGALLGGLLFSYLLLPRLGLTGSALSSSALTLGVCGYLLRSRAVTLDRPRAAGLACAAGAWVALLLLSPVVERLDGLAYFARRTGIPRSFATSGSRLAGILGLLWSRQDAVERVPSRYQRIDLVSSDFEDTPLLGYYNTRPSLEPDAPYGLYLFLDRHFQFLGGVEAVYHEFLGDVPIQLFGRVPPDILILGGGDGLLAKEFLKYGDRVRSITNVELDPAMVELARDDLRLRALNKSAFRDPKVRVLVADAASFVRATGERYDAVFIDFPFPNTYDTSKLYSVEFFRNVARVLKPGGFGAIDYPLAPTQPEDAPPDPEGIRRNSVLMSTLRAAGYQTLVPYATDCPELLPFHIALRMVTLGSEEDPDEEDARLLRKVKARRFLRRHPGLGADTKEDLVLVESPTRETMLAFAYGRPPVGYEFKDYGVELHALNAVRLRTLEGGVFEWREEPRYVNTHLRPTLFRRSLSSPRGLD